MTFFRMKHYYFEYFLTKVLAITAKLLPLKIAHLSGDLLGDLFYHLIRIRKKVALRNLGFAFGNEKTAKDLKKILRLSYRHFGRMLLEFARLPRFNRMTLMEQIPIHDRQLVDELFVLKKGLMILTAHFGNWEYLAAGLANLGYPFYSVYREQKNMFVDNIIEQYRANTGMRLLKVKGGAAKGILTVLKEKAMVLIVMDQDAGRHGVMLDFLGKPASTNRGAATIAIKLRIPVVMALGVRNRDGLIHIHLEKFQPIQQFTNDEQGTIQFINEYNKILEKYIRQYPEQWFWMHRRWKTQPKISS